MQIESFLPKVAEFSHLYTFTNMRDFGKINTVPVPSDVLNTSRDPISSLSLCSVDGNP